MLVCRDVGLTQTIAQVRVMTALRHPNVVLFMAACTKPPKLCIVMEFMALGSLFEVRGLIAFPPEQERH
jgi:serine/threonine protein kinase